MDVADLSAMATVFPGVSSERRQKSPRLPEGKARSLSARSQYSGSPAAATVAEGLEPSWSYGASAQEDQLDRYVVILSNFMSDFN